MTNVLKVSSLILIPFIGILFLYFYDSNHTSFILPEFHTISMIIASVLSLLMALVSAKSYKKLGYPIFKYISIGFTGFALIYTMHGILTQLMGHNMFLFLVYGPVSRIITALYLLFGIMSISDFPDKTEKRKINWPLHVGIFLILNIISYFAASSSFYTISVQKSLEGVSAAVSIISLIYMFNKLKIDSSLTEYSLITISIFLQASIAFLLSKPWSIMWWYAHVIFGLGFIIVTIGVIKSYNNPDSVRKVIRYFDGSK